MDKLAQLAADAALKKAFEFLGNTPYWEFQDITNCVEKLSGTKISKISGRIRYYGLPFVDAEVTFCDRGNVQGEHVGEFLRALGVSRVKLEICTYAVHSLRSFTYTGEELGL